MRGPWVRMAWVLCVIGCGGGERGATPETEGTPQPETTTPEPPAPLPPPTGLRVRAEPETGSAAWRVVVGNGGSESVSLSSEVSVQRETDGAFSEAVKIALRFDCQAEAPRCVVLAPGAELHPPAWLGTIGDAQCVCTRCGPAPAGRYRFVVRPCDGGAEAPSEPFEVAAR